MIGAYCGSVLVLILFGKMINVIDTHTHLDAVEFNEDRAAVFERARAAGVCKVFLPAIDLKTARFIMALSQAYPGYAYPMVGLHPEEVREDWFEQLTELANIIRADRAEAKKKGDARGRIIAIGEVGLDYYWSREFAQEQLEAFKMQVQWSVSTGLPLMIHCRKAQSEMVRVLRKYKSNLPGGVFHCFTGNQKEAEELLSFDKFVLGIGGVSTFKTSHLREDLPAVVPMDRIVLETDSPYMAPVPHRGQRNESAYVMDVLSTLAKSYGVTPDELAHQTNENVKRVFGIEAVSDVQC